MAWPRSNNSRSSAQPGTEPHDDVQAVVSPAPDAEPPPGSGQNTGISGTTHTVASDGGWPGASGRGDESPRTSRRLLPIRYAHSGNAEPAPPTRPHAVPGPPPTGTRSAEIVPPRGELPPTTAPASGLEPPADEPPADRVLSGTVLANPGLANPGPVDEEPDDYEGTAGLVYEAPRPHYSDYRSDEPGEPGEPVRNEGLGIFGGVATTEVPEDDVSTREFDRRPNLPPLPDQPSPAGPVWNQPIAPPPVASSEPQERRTNPFERIRGRLAGGPPQDDGEPRVSVRDLPPDVQLRFIRDRVIIVLVVGVLSFIIWRNWPISITLVVVAFVLDMMRRSRSAALYVNGGAHPGARKATSKQLRKMRRDGYFTLDARPIPDSREFIDHLVIGPTGVYAIDSEKWDPGLPIRTWNGKKLYHGPESQKERLSHALWEAEQASEILSGALGYEIKVKPALAIYGPKIPWNVATIRNVDVFTGPALGKYLKTRGRMKDGVTRLTREQVRTIYDTATRMLPSVTAEDAYTPVG